MEKFDEEDNSFDLQANLPPGRSKGESMNLNGSLLAKSNPLLQFEGEGEDFSSRGSRHAKS